VEEVGGVGEGLDELFGRDVSLVFLKRGGEGGRVQKAGSEGNHKGKATSSSISKRVKPPYFGDGGRAGGFMIGDDAEAGSLGAGDTIAAERFGAGEVVDVVNGGDVQYCTRLTRRAMSARG